MLRSRRFWKGRSRIFNLRLHNPGRQGRIKGGGGNRGNRPGPPAARGPRDEIYLFQIKYSFEKFRDSEAIQEYNSIYSMLRWVSRAHNSNWFLYKFDCLPILVIAIE